jgi:5,5'-dehydrodivanillate O-demethylase
MLTQAENDRLSRVGHGTPGGELFRRYWHPIAASSQLAERGTRPIRLLGEDLVLFRDRQGQLGLVGNRCPHRRAGMVFGIPEQDGLRCAYHGWLWAADGQCLEQPYEQTEDPASTFKNRVRITAYPVQEFAGLIFAYLGPEPAPLLPHWDLYVLPADVPRDIGYAVIPCNWLQIAENSIDPVHVEWLHGHFTNYALERLGQDRPRRKPGKHEAIGFSVFDYGIIKRRILEGETEEDEDWATGHPHVFPNFLKSGSLAKPVYQIRVPMDDTRTMYFWYSIHQPRPGEVLPKLDSIPFYDVPIPGLGANNEPEWSLVDNNSGQDMAMWFTQGEIADRSLEHLGASDKGVALFRAQLELNIRKVEQGEDPMNVFRDPAENVCLELPVEGAKLGGATGYFGARSRQGNVTKYSPILQQVEELAAKAAGAVKSPAR